MIIQSSRIHSAEYVSSSPRTRGPSTRRTCRIARHCNKRSGILGPRVRGDDTLRAYAVSLALALLTCLIAIDTQSAPLPSQLGPEVAVTRPRDGYVGRLNVAPE